MSDTRRAQWTTIIAAGLVLGVALGHRHASGLYQLPIAGDLSLSRESFSLAIAVQNLLWGLAMPFTGLLADRHNAAWVLLAGLVLYAAGLVASVYVTGPGGLTLSMGALVGLGLGATTWIVNGAVAQAVPPARRPMALGVTSSIGAGMQFVMLPLVALGIGTLGWRGTLVATAALFVASMPLLFALRTRPAAAAAGAHAQERLGVAGVLGSRDLWLIWLGFASCGFHLAFIGVHLPAYLADKGIGGDVAATALAVVGLFNVIGTYVFGLIGQRYPKRLVLAALYAVRTLAIVVYVTAPVSAASTIVFGAVMGFLWLSTAPLTTSLVGAMFGIGSLSTLFGWVFLGHQIGGFLGVWLGGRVFDTTGSYTLVWVLAVAIGIVSTVANLLVAEPATGRGTRSPARPA